MRIYRGLITKLPSNGIFVFGSNTQGRHFKGAALTALRYFGAIIGQASGLQGRSWAIVTKDLTKSHHPSISINAICESILELYTYAIRHPHLDFYIAYAGKGDVPFLNGYTPQQMASMFERWHRGTPLNNIIFEEHFAELINIP